MADVRAALERASIQFVRTVAALDQPSWEHQTPCEVSVRELVEHVLAGNEFAVRLLAGATADEARAEIDQIRLGEEPAEQARMSCSAQTDAFVSADRTGVLHHPNGDIDFETFVRLRLGELVVHGWDIAVGAALDATLDPSTVGDLWSRVKPHRDQMRSMGSYGIGPTDSLPPGAPLQQRLLHAFGRRS